MQTVNEFICLSKNDFDDNYRIITKCLEKYLTLSKCCLSTECLISVYLVNYLKQQINKRLNVDLYWSINECFSNLNVKIVQTELPTGSLKFIGKNEDYIFLTYNFFIDFEAEV